MKLYLKLYIALLCNFLFYFNITKINIKNETQTTKLYEFIIEAVLFKTSKSLYYI